MAPRGKFLGTNPGAPSGSDNVPGTAGTTPPCAESPRATRSRVNRTDQARGLTAVAAPIGGRGRLRPATSSPPRTAPVRFPRPDRPSVPARWPPMLGIFGIDGTNNTPGFRANRGRRRLVRPSRHVCQVCQVCHVRRAGVSWQAWAPATRLESSGRATRPRQALMLTRTCPVGLPCVACFARATHQCFVASMGAGAGFAGLGAHADDIAQASMLVGPPTDRPHPRQRLPLLLRDPMFIWTIPIPLPLRPGPGRCLRAQPRHDTRPVWQRSRMRRCRRTDARKTKESRLVGP
jgi:hypothetical protein